MNIFKGLYCVFVTFFIPSFLCPQPVAVFANHDMTARRGRGAASSPQHGTAETIAAPRARAIHSFSVVPRPSARQHVRGCTRSCYSELAFQIYTRTIPQDAHQSDTCLSPLQAELKNKVHSFSDI